MLVGAGSFVDDITPERVTHASFVRSPYAHASVRTVDASEARDCKGVVAVLTANEVDAVAQPLSVADLPPFLPLAGDTVRHVGDPVGLVIADSLYLAEDAAASLEINYEPLPAITTIEQALDPAGPRLFRELPSNVVFSASSTYGDVDGAFAGADTTIGETFRQQRCAAVPMEGRGGIATFDSVARSLTYLASTQNPHGLRLSLAAALDLPVQSVKVVSADVGGGFGQKMVLYREDVAVCVAAMLVGRPVKWVEDRTENMTASGHARDDVVELEAAVLKDGTILGLRGAITLDQGAYAVFPLPSSAFTAHVRALLPDCYRIPAFAFDETVVATTKPSYVPYRGPWASAPWSREVLLDLVARDLGLEPSQVRLRNLIAVEEQPARMITGASLERASARTTLTELLDVVRLEEFRTRQADARERGRLLGLGLATFIEPAPGPQDLAEATGLPVPPERAAARLEPDGRLTVLTAQHPQGQGHETTLAQVAADAFGIPFDHVRVVHGDTRETPFSALGTSGSRAATRATGATQDAVQELRRRALEIAGSLLETASDDLEITDGVVMTKGVPRRELSLADVAHAAYLGAPHLPAGHQVGALEAARTFEEPPGGWTSATHCCIVEVCPETCLVRILRYVVAHDCGEMINPAIVAGQVHGGVAQGIGAALLEEAVYDEEGNPLAAQMLDYLLPGAVEIPPIELLHIESPPVAHLDIRGVGEGGAIGAPPAVTNAVADALGVAFSKLPLTPSRIFEALQAAGASSHQRTS